MLDLEGKLKPDATESRDLFCEFFCVSVGALSCIKALTSTPEG